MSAKLVQPAGYEASSGGSNSEENANSHIIEPATFVVTELVKIHCREKYDNEGRHGRFKSGENLEKEYISTAQIKLSLLNLMK
jgi:hypothetical protein